ncbi:MAG: hypothetical protein HC779_00445 [Phyllobacteriaceae bacterium]|nr:hypothetical protein [Phyllobacteriaceae bacterium]
MAPGVEGSAPGRPVGAVCAKATGAAAKPAVRPAAKTTASGSADTAPLNLALREKRALRDM